MSFHVDLNSRLRAGAFGWLGHEAIDYIARTSRTARCRPVPWCFAKAMRRKAAT
jgi:hypothetical protein